MRPTTRTQRAPRRDDSQRRGIAAMELVMTTAIVFPAVAFCVTTGILFLRTLFSVIGTMIGCPAM